MNYITEYNDDWPSRFSQIIAYIEGYLPAGCMFHHVGSTSVPAMPAKDIIDLDIEYARGSLQEVIDGLRRAGYEHKGDKGIPGRDAFKPVPDTSAESLPVHHLYACEIGADELFKHLVYRDYLIAHPARAEWLANQKIAVDAASKSRDEYIEKKSSCYTIIVGESVEWAGRHAT